MDIVIAGKKHIHYAKEISELIASSAQVRGTGIARRTPAYIVKKIENKNAVIALDGDVFAGFCYIEVWGHSKYVAHSGLIVAPEYRGKGLAKAIKTKTFDYSREKYPDAKVFGITTGLPVMKINYELGYKPVTFSELTDDPEFWKGCQTCKNYDVLTRTDRKMCLCTGMLHDPKADANNTAKTYDNAVMSRLNQIKQSLFLNKKKS
ncbi:MAG: GNAT family N-acetyltransferase [Bacteroidota bacterium]|nr:GNAT family N-acetyltransferase [Bacteroidota bacterium]